MNKVKTGPGTMYTDTPCNKCDGPTLLLNGGSIWCPAEDPHPGGHFVTRVAFERTPAKQRAFEASRGMKPQPVVARPRAVVASPKPVDPYATGMDAFVESDR